MSPQAVMFHGMGQRTISSDGSSSYYPSLDEGPEKRYVPVSKWWDQVVFVLNPKTKLTRKSIVLAAANKDGGAHVDNKLSPDYAGLAKEGAVGTLVYKVNGKESKTDIQDAHLVALRQMAHELLNSPELLAI
ncbi:hypothetical protein [Psychrosphaera saromensis]|nr:hypothetical protein [Psychrosphaera saromensis]